MDKNTKNYKLVSMNCTRQVYTSLALVIEIVSSTNPLAASTKRSSSMYIGSDAPNPCSRSMKVTSSPRGSNPAARKPITAKNRIKKKTKQLFC